MCVRMNVGIIPQMAGCPQALRCLLLKADFTFSLPIFLVVLLSTLHRRLAKIVPVQIHRAGVSPMTEDNFTKNNTQNKEIISRWLLEYG